jgi:hypothetical protein
MRYRLDSALFRSDIRDLAARIKDLKRVLRTRWEKPMADEQRELCRLKTRATDLYALRAFSRGKIHVVRAPAGFTGEWDPRAYHRRIAERLGPTYSLSEVASP